MKILIVHYDKLIERKEHILQELRKYDLTCDFVSNYGKDKLTDKDKSKFKNLKDSEISLSLHHFECYKIISENYDYAIIFEDDVILAKNFRSEIEKHINELPSDWDMLFFGEGHGAHIPSYRLEPNKNVYRKSVELVNKNIGGINGSSRCADSYIVSNKCCKKILEKINSPNYIVTMPLDHLLNHLNYNNKFNVYWSEPTLTIQGTSNGLFKSSLDR